MPRRCRRQSGLIKLSAAEGAFVEQARIHHTLVGQVLDNHVDEFDLRGRSNAGGDEITEGCANCRAVESNQGAHEPAEPPACLTGALDITGLADTGIQKHLFKFAQIGRRKRFTLP